MFLEEALVAVETVAGANLQDADVVETAVLALASVVVDSDATSTTVMIIVHRARSATSLGILPNGASTGLKKPMNLNKSKLWRPLLRTTSTPTGTPTSEQLTTSRRS
jgi:hypothetical protein